MNKFAAMQAFVKVVELGSFSKAADVLGLPNPSVTRLVKSLEAHLHAKLLNRTTRHLSLTTEGNRYHTRALELLAELQEIEDTFVADRGVVKGHLRVEIPGWVAEKLLVPALPAFRSTHPNISLELRTCDSPGASLGADVDVSIRVGFIEPDALHVRKLGELDCVPVASTSYLRGRSPLGAPHELCNEAHQALATPGARATRSAPQVFLRAHEVVEVPTADGLSLDEMNSYIRAAESGLGVVVAPALLVKDRLQNGALHRLFDGWLCPPMQLQVVWKPDRHVPSKLTTFITWLEAVSRTHPAVLSA